MARDLNALHGHLVDRLALPFAWGRNANDCVGAVLAAVFAMTGRDLLPGVTWSTERDAVRVAKQLGGLQAAIDARLRSVAPAAAMRGDIAAILDGRFGISLMIVEGATLVGPGARGLKRVPRSMMVGAWDIEGTADV